MAQPGVMGTMQHVVIEQTFGAPVSDMQIAAARLGTTRNGAVPRTRAFLSRDRLRLVSLYEMPDASTWQGTAPIGGETARYTNPVHLIAHSQPECPAGYSLVVAQRDLSGVEGLTVQAVQHLASDPLGCGKRLRLTHLGGYLSHDLSRMVCVYFAPDMESVRKANLENGVPWEHLWRGDWLSD